MSARTQIVEALAKVDGLNPTSSTPGTVMAGSAWTVWSFSTWINACVSADTYFVFVALPNGATAATIDAGDELMEDVSTVLWAVGKIARVEPWAWPAEPGQQSIPVLRFTLEI
jgi:hypothetical protein